MHIISEYAQFRFGSCCMLHLRQLHWSSVLLHICTPPHNAMVGVDTGVLNMIVASHLTLLILYRGPTMKNVVNSIYNPFARRKRPPPVVEQP